MRKCNAVKENKNKNKKKLVKIIINSQKNKITLKTVKSN